MCTSKWLQRCSSQFPLCSLKIHQTIRIDIFIRSAAAAENNIAGIPTNGDSRSLCRSLASSALWWTSVAAVFLSRLHNSNAENPISLGLAQLIYNDLFMDFSIHIGCWRRPQIDRIADWLLAATYTHIQFRFSIPSRLRFGWLVVRVWYLWMLDDSCAVIVAAVCAVVRRRSAYFVHYVACTFKAFAAMHACVCVCAARDRRA